MEGKLLSTFQDVFVFFASNATDFFSKHLEYLFTKSKISLTPVMVKLFTDEGLILSLVQFLVSCIFAPLVYFTEVCRSQALISEVRSVWDL